MAAGAPHRAVPACSCDDGTRRARRGGRTLDLTPAGCPLLRHLLVNAERVLSRGRIGRYVRGEFRGGNAIEPLVSRLGRKVDRDDPHPAHQAVLELLGQPYRAG